MVKKWLPKIIFYSALGGLFLVSCLEPVDYGLLAKDERIQDYIDSKRGLVIVNDKTSHEEEKLLIGGNKIITGLKAEKYYMVESERSKKEGDKEGELKTGYPKYVTDRLELVHWLEHLGHITYVKEEKGVIQGLTNGHTYTVRDAKPFDDGSFSLTFSGHTGRADIVEGIAEIPNLEGETFTFDLSGILDGEYEYVEIPILEGVVRLELEPKPFEGEITQAINTTFDYVFVNSDVSKGSRTTDNIKPEDFRVLRVVGIEVDDKVKLTIKVNHLVFVVLKENEYRLDLSKLTSYDIDDLKITIEVENVDEFDSFKWYYQGNELNGNYWSGDTVTGTVGSSSFTLEFNNDNVGKGFQFKGKHVFTVVGIINNRPYNKNFTLDIF